MMIRFVFFLFFGLVSVRAESKPQLRCGWWWNTPGETSLTDKDAAWTVREQGVYEAASVKGVFKTSSNNAPAFHQPIQGSSYRECACVKGTFDLSKKRVVRIESRTQKKITDCHPKSQAIFASYLIGNGHTVVTEPGEAKLQASLSQSDVHIEGTGIFNLTLLKKIEAGYLCKTDSGDDSQRFVLVKAVKNVVNISFSATEALKDPDSYDVVWEKDK